MLPQMFLVSKYRYRLSVPYFTGFVMLHRTYMLNTPAPRSFSPLFYGIRDATISPWQAIQLSMSLSVPYFTGFVMLPKSRGTATAYTAKLSVPYFTGFVMLQIGRTFIEACQNLFQSPILRDS